MGSSFWDRVKIGAPNECWEWTRAFNKKGYGKFSMDNMRAGRLTHRIAFDITNGPIPTGLCVLHKCDNPPCCNPAHLFLGTHDDNMRDMMAKGRHKSVVARGEKSCHTKLTKKQIEDIKFRLSQGQTGISIANMYGVGRSTISRIRTNQNWSDKSWA